MKHILFVTAAFILLGFSQACNDDSEGVTPDTPGGPSGQLTAASDCKHTASGKGLRVQDSNESAVEYSYNPTTSVLILKHINAAFNCCPGALSASVRVEDNLITISEKESEAACNCNCLYDLDIEISRLPQKSWNIVFVEPYLSPPDLPLSFVIDLTSSSSGRYAVPRARYPWGI